MMIDESFIAIRREVFECEREERQTADRRLRAFMCRVKMYAPTLEEWKEKIA